MKSRLKLEICFEFFWTDHYGPIVFEHILRAWCSCSVVLMKVSSSFAEASSSKKEGETMLDVKLGDLEQHLKAAEKQLLQSQVSRIDETLG